MILVPVTLLLRPFDPLISIPSSANCSHSVAQPGTASAQFILETDGDVMNKLADIGDWITPKIGMTNYECKWDQVSGSAPTTSPASAGTWVALGSVNRSWFMNRSTLGVTQGVIDVSVRKVGTSTPVGVCRVSMFAEVDSGS